MRPGSFATTTLALSHASVPDAVYPVTPEPGTPINGPSTVQPQFGQPGGGQELTFPQGAGPGTGWIAFTDSASIGSYDRQAKHQSVQCWRSRSLLAR
jgi:hypothetical protein